MNVVDNFESINMRVSRIEKAIFSQVSPSKLKALPRVVKEMRHSLGIIEESILSSRRSKGASATRGAETLSLDEFGRKLKANFEMCNEQFAKMQVEVRQFQGLFEECLRVADFRDKEDLILILKRENEVKQKLLNKYKALVADSVLRPKAGAGFDAEFNRRFRTSAAFVKLLFDENSYLMSKNAEISQKIVASKMEINKRLERIQSQMKFFWRSLSAATGKDAVSGHFGKKRTGAEASLVEFGRHKSDFRKMLIRHEKCVEQVSKAGEGILIEIQKEFGRLKKACKGFGFLELFSDLAEVKSQNLRVIETLTANLDPSKLSDALESLVDDFSQIKDFVKRIQTERNDEKISLVKTLTAKLTAENKQFEKKQVEILGALQSKFEVQSRQIRGLQQMGQSTSEEQKKVFFSKKADVFAEMARMRKAVDKLKKRIYKKKPGQVKCVQQALVLMREIADLQGSLSEKYSDMSRPVRETVLRAHELAKTLQMKVENLETEKVMQTLDQIKLIL